MGAMKKSQGSLVAEGYLVLLLGMLLVGLLLRAVPHGLHTLGRLCLQAELDRVEQDLHARLEARFLFDVEQVQVAEEPEGTVVRCYGGPGFARRDYYVKESPSSRCPVLYRRTWNPQAKKPGVNPISPDHVAVTGFAAKLAGPGRLSWKMTLIHRKTGVEKEFREVFSYGP